MGTRDYSTSRSLKRSRFSADWPAVDDTSGSFSEEFREAPLLFGRGFRAGIDRVEQKKKQLNKSSSPWYKLSSPCWSAKKLSDMTLRDWRIFQEDFGISYKGSHVHTRRPMRNWEESGLGHDILNTIRKAGYVKPSPIQMAAVPLGLAHVDVIGIAETGSGKTASFIIPLLHYISSLPSLLHNKDNEVQGPHALVLAPTRELALQIHDEAVKLSRYMDVKAITVVRGHTIEKQGMEVSRGCDVIIATPGRLLDCLERRFVVLNQCKYVVVDEADRMVAKGFEGQVVQILNALPRGMHNNGDDVTHEDKADHVTLSMFSATMPSAIERIARCYLRDPVIIDMQSTRKSSIIQQVIMVEASEKLQKLESLLHVHGQSELILVFVNSRAAAYKLVQQLDQHGYMSACLHGGMLQVEREASLNRFKRREIKCLVATEVAGRGIDVQGISHVVNYDMPDTIEKYTHRIGRTGRAGNTGLATTFLSVSDAQVFYDLKHFLIQSNSLVPPGLARHQASKTKPGTLYDHCD